MNQILNTIPNKKYYKIKNWFKFQFFISILIIFIISIGIFMYFKNLQEKANLSKKLINNYDIYKLYSNQRNNSFGENSNGLFRNY